MSVVDEVGHPDGYACAQAWTALSAAHALVAERLGAALGRACGLSVNEFEVLLKLDRAPAPALRLGDLQPAVPLTQPSLSRLTNRLEQQGWLSRRADPTDGRGVLVGLTPAGRETLRRGVQVHAATIREALLDRLTPTEQQLLAEALGRVTEAQPGSRVPERRRDDHPHDDRPDEQTPRSTR